MRAIPIGQAGAFDRLKLPLYQDAVSAGFPSPATDYVEKALDLNELCIRRPAATFFVRADGDSMIEAGIHSGDVLVVDRSVQAQHGDIIIACVHGELTVKELQLRPRPRLVPRNRRYPVIELSEDVPLDVFGVVVGVVRVMRRDPK